LRHAAVTGVALIGLAAPAVAQDGESGLFRLFLTDGRALTSYGEWARLDDRVVFSMPTRRGDPTAELHLVTIPASQVDWARTDRYATALRARAYAATRGEADFAQLGDTVARTLNEIATLKDPNERLARAELARRTLNEWPGTHYGYRAVEVREILGMLDEVIAGLRAATGQGAFELSLMALPALLPDEPPLPEPTEAETVEQLMTAAELAATPAERSRCEPSSTGGPRRRPAARVVGGPHPPGRRGGARQGGADRSRVRGAPDGHAGLGHARHRARRRARARAIAHECSRRRPAPGCEATG
jgi:hypothetical protein